MIILTKVYICICIVTTIILLLAYIQNTEVVLQAMYKRSVLMLPDSHFRALTNTFPRLDSISHPTHVPRQGVPSIEGVSGMF